MATVKMTIADWTQRRQTVLVRTFSCSQFAQAYIQQMYLLDADSVLAVELTIEGGN